MPQVRWLNRSIPPQDNPRAWEHPSIAKPAIAQWTIVFLYAATVGVSAFLLFVVQPILAKILLPRFGGSAAVWTTCLVFFQTVLLLGYLYAHTLTSRLRPLQQAGLHISLLLVSLFFLPISLESTLNSAIDPTWQILAALTLSVGVPYFLLSATSPLLQNWFARSYALSSAYRLFALSNLASLLALLSYPFGIEPWLSTQTQVQTWSAAFVLFAVLCGVTAWITRTAPLVQNEQRQEATIPQLRARKLIWFGLSAVSSMLLLAITNHLCQNVAAVPFLWVYPLALYLFTFILCFESHRWYRRSLFLRLLAVALGVMGYALSDFQLTESIPISLLLFGSGLFVGCMFCHGELNQLRPDTRQLTSFYVNIAFGGMAGAIFVAMLAPHLFSGIYELPVTLLLVALFAVKLTWTNGWNARLLWACVSAAMAVMIFVHIRAYEKNSLVMTRNFYGALRVQQSRGIGDKQRRTLFHGTVEHGAQFVLPPGRSQPTTYYGPDSGVGRALRFCCQTTKRIGVIGLGTGTLAAYGHSGDYFCFYELNPDIIRLASSVFTYLRESKAQIRIVPGDARLSLEAEPSQQYDVLVLDAFSGDAIPVHLLTKEAVAVYSRHLKPNGVLAIHISNQYLNLAPVVQQLIALYGYDARLIKTGDSNTQMLAAADWMLATRNASFLDFPYVRRSSEKVNVPSSFEPWTDDYNDLFEVIKWKPEPTTHSHPAQANRGAEKNGGM